MKRSRWLRFKRDDAGVTAIEFAGVALPFFMLLFGLIGVAFFYFVLTSIEKGMDQTSRLIRTGQAQSSGMTVKQFKDAICSEAGSWIRCNNLQVFVSAYASWAAVQAEACVDAGGNPRTNPAPPGQMIGVSSGGASEIVIVTACYKWDLPASIPFIEIDNMSNADAYMMQSTTAFRAEPYEENN
ncbi:MAG: pilus assembly protein TadE [Hyphomicrobium sp.]|nr:MAG: pilus assembly protein TadE [Hyphomicrobium sp.]PPC99238.1 MAG: pilus assembly protein TadE [Hyphomicrobium sp.]